MKQELVKILEPEVVIDTEWFNATLVRQEDGRLLAHIIYSKWTPTAKRKTIEAMNSFDEPLYAFIHDTHHLKYLNAIGFVPTGRLVTCPFPGKEGQIFGEVVYIKGGIDSYILQSYEEAGRVYLPFEAVDGYGNIEAIEEKLKAFPEASWETKHHFSDGVYTRETFVPKDTLLTGWRHRQETISILLSGTISVMSVDTSGRAEDKGVLQAPAIFITKPGSKKIGFAHEDTIFVNSFPLSEIPMEYRNVESIEKVEEYFFDKEDTLCLG